MLPHVVLHVVRGFLMGAADIVPGVSGGTVALVVGIYTRLVENVHTGARALGRLARLDPRGAWERLRAVEWLFVIPLLAGIGAAVVTLAGLIEGLLHDHPEEMAGLFCGLVLASVLVAADQVRAWGTQRFAVLAVVAAATFVVLGFQSGVVADPSFAAFFGAGAIAICAMILPGISGSFLLLMLGMYVPVLGAVNEREIADLGVFLVGAVLGLALFSTLLNWLLARFADVVLAALIGLMLGSVRVLWPWPNGVGVISDDADEIIDGTQLGWPDSLGSFLRPTLLAIGAFAVVLGISRLAALRLRSQVG